MKIKFLLITIIFLLSFLLLKQAKELRNYKQAYEICKNPEIIVEQYKNLRRYGKN